jgi:hypothetical protein
MIKQLKVNKKKVNVNIRTFSNQHKHSKTLFSFLSSNLTNYWFFMLEPWNYILIESYFHIFRLLIFGICILCRFICLFVRLGPFIKVSRCLICLTICISIELPEECFRMRMDCLAYFATFFFIFSLVVFSLTI